MALLSLFETAFAFMLLHPVAVLLISPTLFICTRCLYRLSPLHPLGHLPGPWLPSLTSTWLYYHTYTGNECTAVHQLHQRYGSVVRTGPNSVDIADGTALHPIYVEKGGFLKALFYNNFDIGGFHTIFSELIPEVRAPKAKAVAPLFSTANIRAGQNKIQTAVDAFVARLEREKGRALQGDGRLDIKSICRGLAIDAVTGYLFDRRYGGSDEDLKGRPGKLTADAMVESFVAVGNRWYLAPIVFQTLERLFGTLWPDETATQSIDVVHDFCKQVVEQAKLEKQPTTYPARLLAIGMSEEEVCIQCEDLIFAGTDSTAMNLATICFMLCKHPATYIKLRKEVTQHDPSWEDLQSLPYLRGVVREGLRLAMANPSRLARVVPQGGWMFKNTFFPTGTIVSCTPFELHFNPDIFPEPRVFKPERWLTQSSPTDEMNRDHIAFGLGARQCIARNLATAELFCAVKRIAQDDLLRDMRNVKEDIDIMQWFNSHVKGGRIDLSIH